MNPQQLLVSLFSSAFLILLPLGSMGDNVHIHAESLGNSSSNSQVNAVELDSNKTALYDLQNISTVEGFIALLRKEDGQSLSLSDVFSEFDSETGKFVVAEGGGRLAEPDDCSPRMTTVRLNFTYTDPKVVYFPRCTKIERCGGCCSSPNLECVPSYTERVSLKVFKAEVPSTDATQFVYKGFAPMIVERHVICRVQCTLNASKCGANKNFLSNQCMCKCRETLRCQPPRTWDPDECRCTCAIQMECCPSGQQCGLIFDRETCQCTLNVDAVRVASNNNYTEDEIRHYLQSIENTELNAVGSNNSPSTSTTTTTTTTTTNTTPPPTTVSDPCANVNCPSGMSHAINPATNRCICRFQMRNRGLNGSQRALAP